MRIEVTRISISEVWDMEQCPKCGTWNVAGTICRCRLLPEAPPDELDDAEPFSSWFELGGES